MNDQSSGRFRFEVALSLAGDDQRDKVRAVAEILRKELGARRVFFDEWFEAEIAGHDAHVVLQNIYGKESRLVVTCVCQGYADRPWPQEEWRAIQAFERGLRDAGAGNQRRMRFLPLRFGDGNVDGLFETAIVPDVRDRDPRDIAALILERRRLSGGEALSREEPRDLNLPTEPTWPPEEPTDPELRPSAAGGLQLELRSGEQHAYDRFLAQVDPETRTYLLASGFSEDDVERALIVVREHMSNAIRHTAVASPAALLELQADREQLSLQVLNCGAPFPLDETLRALATRMAAGEREHGLLRARRYGSQLSSVEVPSYRGWRHAVVWKRSRRPAHIATIFEAAHEHGVVVPIVVQNWRFPLLRVGGDLYHEFELTAGEALGSAFFRLYLEPVRRSAAPYLAYEVRGRSATRPGDRPMPGPWLFEALWALRNEVFPGKRVIVFVDAEYTDHTFFHRVATAYPEIELFEDARACTRRLQQLMTTYV